MAVEFLSDQQAAQYAAFSGAPSRAELERYFFLDDSDLEKVQAKRARLLQGQGAGYGESSVKTGIPKTSLHRYLKG
ncbi:MULTISPECIES: DUF4158 domain-containing protein [Streptomyces]|uniref:DUF4158 domain-containing protein n=1 Tax=Streptomyces sp. 900129855 TaxID=3155129 RepID=A0ABV2ZYW1_9ACTN